jgi:hypothetical protein
VSKHPLTFAGGDVRPTHRRADGRAVVVYLNRAGEPTRHTAVALPHELRGIGWHIAEIKKLIASLPLESAPAPETAAPRPPLFSHHVAAAQED